LRSGPGDVDEDNPHVDPIRNAKRMARLENAGQACNAAKRFVVAGAATADSTTPSGRRC